MDTLIKALRHFETLMDQSLEALETIAGYAGKVMSGTPLDPESWQKISSYAAERVKQLVDGLQEIAPDEYAAFTATESLHWLIPARHPGIDLRPGGNRGRADRGRVYQALLDPRCRS